MRRAAAFLALLALVACEPTVGPTVPSTAPSYLEAEPAIRVLEPTTGAVFRAGDPIRISWVAVTNRADTPFKATVLRRVDGGPWGDVTESGVLLHGTILTGDEVVWENWELAYLGTIPDGRYVIRVESDVLRPELLRAWGESGVFTLRREALKP